MPPMKTFRNGEVWLKGFEAAGIRMVPAGGWHEPRPTTKVVGLHL